MKPDEMHVKLCADLLGETSEAEHLEIEQALLRDPALRAERERLARTIGLVESTLGGAEAETMPAATRDRLIARATARRTPWKIVTVALATAAAAGLAMWIGSTLDRPAVGDAPKSELIARDDRAGVSKWKEAEKSADSSEIAVENDTQATGGAARLDAPKPAGPEPGAGGEAAKADDKAKFEKWLKQAGYAGGELRDLGQTDREQAPTDGTHKTMDERLAAEQAAPASTPTSNKTVKKDESVAAVEEQKNESSHGAAFLLQTAPVVKPPADSTPPIPEVHDSVSEKSNTESVGPATGSGAGGKYAKRGVMGGRGKLAPPAVKAAPKPGADDLYKAQSQLKAPPKESTVPLTDAVTGAVTRAGDDGDAEKLGKLLVLNEDALDDRAKSRVSADDVLQSCRRLPNESPSMMFFRFWGDHRFERTATNAQSTFGVDVDTASYPLARNYIERGQLPPKEAVRTEEFLNWFRADVPAPTDRTFAVHLDGGKSRFGDPSDLKDGRLLRVVIRGKDVSKSERQPLKLTCVIDVSGSMQMDNRLELVKNALRLLLAGLEPRDAVALVTFSTDGRLVLPMTSVADRATIEAALQPLAPSGSTNAEAGVRIGYAEAGKNFDPECANRVVLFSDGVANTGETDQDRITAEVAKERERGILLNTYGVGMGNHNDVLLEQLADKGNGACAYIDTTDEAKRQLVDRFTGAMQTIARDVKIQVEFDPVQVDRWRLLGYENRAIANQDFRNDKVDAGEVGAGHQITALYEIEPAAEFGTGKPVATVRLRWLPPVKTGTPSDVATETETTILATSLATDWVEQSFGLKRAALVAQFAEFLRRSQHARGDSIEELATESHALATVSGDKDVADFATLVDKSRAMIPQLPANDPLTDALDAVRRNRVLRAELEDLAQARDRALMDELEKQNAELEARIRELLKGRLGK